MKPLSILALAVFAVLLFSDASFAQSCPMCKESMTQAGAELSKGFYYSIISLFTMPFILFGGIGSVVFKSWWSRTHPDEIVPLRVALRRTLDERKARRMGL